ncbi:MAG: hypothetical protein KTR21_06940 [Rhodobacteraceae bacterium]|nr:hypothetical protein [Paracoccaceae bacterium]
MFRLMITSALALMLATCGGGGGDRPATTRADLNAVNQQLSEAARGGWENYQIKLSELTPEIERIAQLCEQPGVGKGLRGLITAGAGSEPEARLRCLSTAVEAYALLADKPLGDAAATDAAAPETRAASLRAEVDTLDLCVTGGDKPDCELITVMGQTLETRRARAEIAAAATAGTDAITTDLVAATRDHAARFAEASERQWPSLQTASAADDAQGEAMRGRDRMMMWQACTVHQSQQSFLEKAGTLDQNLMREAGYGAMMKELRLAVAASAQAMSFKPICPGGGADCAEAVACASAPEEQSCRNARAAGLIAACGPLGGKLPS